MTKLDDFLDGCEKRANAASEVDVLIIPVPEHPGYYADWEGRIWSSIARWGAWHAVKGFADQHGYLKIKAKRDGKLRKTAVHKMVCLAWRGLPTIGQEVRHLDGTRTNNRPTNLAWGTRSENAHDRKRHGTDRAAENGRKSAYKNVGPIKTHCLRGHLRIPENLIGRACRICHMEDNRQGRIRAKLRALTSMDRIAEKGSGNG